MESSRQSKIFDVVRNCFVAATPEEQVRQKWLQAMVTSLGYPKELIAVEKELWRLPHLLHDPHVPQRRADIICFAKGIHAEHPLFPLLLIECKQEALNAKALDQVMGYNYYVGAPFVAVVNGTHIVMNQGLSTLPSYQELIRRVNP
ncbi:MAG TPA: type I restriction enzyme HsdR N-terminal domain-containing protein [Rhabdochlamydiaceae bacterium]